MKNIVVIVLFALSFGSSAFAQTIISNQTMLHDSTNVTVSFEVQTDVKDLKSNRKEIIRPFVYNGEDTLWFETIEVFGKDRFKRERQTRHINGEKDWTLGENQVIKGGVFYYVSQVPLKRWMTQANLGVRRQLVGCACEKDLSEENLVSGLPLFVEPTLPARRTPEYVLADATQLWDFGPDDLKVFFRVSRADIDTTLFENNETFGKILSAVDKIYADSIYKIEKIEVSGYASPEGPRFFNKKLAERRAQALIDYIIAQRPQYELTYENFSIVNGDENWKGLHKVIANSDFENRDTILAIIDNPELNNNQKKEHIIALDSGKSWYKFLREIYPRLRSSQYVAVYYDSNNENAIEIINQANEMIRQGEYVQALEHIQPVKDDMRAFNTVGVAMMMQGEFEEAIPWFEKALKSNCSKAQANIRAIELELEFEAEQKRAREEFLKRYE